MAGACGSDAPAASSPVPLRQFADSEIPGGAQGASIRRGLALMEHTPDSLPELTGGNLRCTSCHLERGLRAHAAPLAGTFARYPRYIERAGAVVAIEDRVNYCMTRSLAGRALPSRSTEMRDIVAYLAFVSRGLPVGGRVKGEGLPKMPALAGDSGRGHTLYEASCSRCHGASGDGTAAVPSLWGARSYSIGASMARRERAASFIRHNMPLDRPGTLSDQEAFDLAAFINAQPRPDLPDKGEDWPNGDAPGDVPYATAKHGAHLPPPLLPRRHPSGYQVPIPVGR
jgi:thiosulfate dehydrogenase